jgi:hypothetical protein
MPWWQVLQQSCNVEPFTRLPAREEPDRFVEGLGDGQKVRLIDEFTEANPAVEYRPGVFATGGSLASVESMISTSSLCMARRAMPPA